MTSDGGLVMVLLMMPPVLLEEEEEDIAELIEGTDAGSTATADSEAGSNTTTFSSAEDIEDVEDVEEPS
jgi:hypothetical protein